MAARHYDESKHPREGDGRWRQKSLIPSPMTGQKSLFGDDNFVEEKKPAQKKAESDPFKGLESRLREALSRKETVSPADAMTKVGLIPLDGQKDLF